MAGFISKRLFRVVQSVQTASLLAGGRLLHPLTKHTHFSSIGEDPDSHSDFKPVNKAPNEVPSACKLVEKDVKQNPVMIFMKGVPDAPRCGFSALAVNVLKHYGVAFSARNILEDPELKESVKAFSHWPTFPQVFINGQFVGGSDIILDMHKTGELKTLLENAESSGKQN